MILSSIITFILKFFKLIFSSATKTNEPIRPPTRKYKITVFGPDQESHTKILTVEPEWFEPTHSWFEPREMNIARRIAKNGCQVVNADGLRFIPPNSISSISIVEIPLDE